MKLLAIVALLGLTQAQEQLEELRSLETCAHRKMNKDCRGLKGLDRTRCIKGAKAECAKEDTKRRMLARGKKEEDIEDELAELRSDFKTCIDDRLEKYCPNDKGRKLI